MEKDDVIVADKIAKISKTMEIDIPTEKNDSPILATYLLHKSTSVFYDREKSEVIVDGVPVENQSQGENYLPPINLAEEKAIEAYKAFLSRHFENIIVLSGAGSSVGVGGTVKGQTMGGLWGKIIEAVGNDDIKLIANVIECDISDIKNINLEEFLSKVSLLRNLYPEKANGDFESVIKKIEQVIVSNCSLDLTDDAPHKDFLRRLTSRKLKYNRLKLFTTNYDLLFEQAATTYGYVIIDGFSFTYPRIFNGNNFDYDIVLRKNSRIAPTENYAGNVFHLYKLHGSLDWKKDVKSQRVVKCDAQNNPAPIMIFPRSSKYEASYEQPFFEMMTRFQSELRTDNALLLIIGYSFGDKHINSMILEALNVNHSLQLVLVDINIDNDNFKQIAMQSNRNPNIMLIKSTFDKFTTNFPYAEAYSFNANQEDGEKNNESF